MHIAPLQRAYAVAQADQAAGVEAGLGTADPVIAYLDRAPVIFKHYLHPQLARPLNASGRKVNARLNTIAAIDELTWHNAAGKASLGTPGGTGSTMPCRCFPMLYPDEILTGRQLAVAARDVCHDDRREQVFGLGSAAPAGPGTAEFAVWVEDAWQGCGVGGLLVRAIVRLLAEQGFSTAIGVIEPGNLAVRRLVNRIAPDAVTRAEDGMVVVSIPLGSSAAAARDLPHPHRVYPHPDSSPPHWTADSAAAGWPAYERTQP